MNSTGCARAAARSPTTNCEECWAATRSCASRFKERSRMPKLRSDEGAALVYCRVSTKALAGGTSLDSQRALCVARAEGLRYVVTRVTREVHSGAELFERPELSRDRADIRAGR